MVLYVVSCHSNLIKFLGRDMVRDCGLALVSPSLYMYYLILKEKIPKYKEARFDIPSHNITHLA